MSEQSSNTSLADMPTDADGNNCNQDLSIFDRNMAMPEEDRDEFFHDYVVPWLAGSGIDIPELALETLQIREDDGYPGTAQDPQRMADLGEQGIQLPNDYLQSGWRPKVESTGRNMQKMDQLIMETKEIDSPDVILDTALYVSCQLGWQEFVERLLAQGADVNQACSLDWTPLHASCQGGHLECVKLLLQHQANLRSVDNKGWTPLHVACLYGFAAIVQELLSYGADPNTADPQGWTVLHVAADFGRKEVINVLLEAKSDINAKDEEGTSPLMVVSQNRPFPTIVPFLLERGADPNIQNNDGETSLEMALHLPDMGEMERVVRSLLDHNADADIVNNQGHKPLHHALMRADGSLNASIFALILQHTHDLDTPVTINDKTATPLMWAIHQEMGFAIDMLLARHVDVDWADEKGFTALHYAVSKAPHSVISLLDAHADVNKAAKGGITPLHIAAKFRPKVDIVRALLDHGANPLAQDAELNTPFHTVKATMREWGMDQDSGKERLQSQITKENVR